MRLKAVIADDEPLARERMRMLLEDDKDLQIVGECRNGRETIELVRRTPVDLLLLDIQMPGASGFDVLAEMMDQRSGPAIIFVTAHQEHAVHAFEVQAVDYLVKPVERERLHTALARAKSWVTRGDESAIYEAVQEKMAAALRMLEASAAAETYPQRFLVKTGATDAVVRVNDIEWIEAADYYVCLHVQEKEHLLRESIKVLEQRLDPRKFVRLHRSAIVNIEHVREVHRDGREEGWVRLTSGGRVRMNQRGWQRLVSMPGLG
jgi:two-component system LytT family response regulator